MPTSATGHNRAGFTLVELLVAMAVIGLATAVAVITWPREDGAARQTAERLAARIKMASHQSVLTGKPHGLSLAAGGAVFMQRDRAGWRLVSAAEQPRSMQWPSGIAVALERPAAPEADRGGDGVDARAPMVVFDPLGGSDVFAVSVSAPGRRYLITAGADGQIALTRVDHEAGHAAP